MLHRLNSTPARAAIAVFLIAAIAAGVLLFRKGDGDGNAATTTPADGTPTPSAYVAPVYYLCDDDTAEANGVLPGGDPPVVGQPAPDFALCDASGVYLKKLSNMDGKVVWLNFWATWCPPCQHETPILRDLSQRYRDRGLEIVGISVQETSPDDIAEYAERYDLDFTIGFDASGHIFREYKVYALPTQFFIDTNGVIRTVVNGPVDAAGAAALVESLLPASAPSAGASAIPRASTPASPSAGP